MSNGLNYTHGIEELWMSPNNCLMLAKNIKDYLTEYLDSTTIIDYVTSRYAELAEVLSIKDADLRAIGKEAMENGTNTLIVSNDVLKYLENYGFEVISLDEATLTESTLNTVKEEFDDGTYDTIIILDDNYTDNINSIIENYEANTINVKSMSSFIEGDNDYLTNMQQFIDDIRNLSLTD